MDVELLVTSLRDHDYIEFSKQFTLALSTRWDAFMEITTDRIRNNDEAELYDKCCEMSRQYEVYHTRMNYSRIKWKTAMLHRALSNVSVVDVCTLIRVIMVIRVIV